MMKRRELLSCSLQNQFLTEKGNRLEILSELCGLQAQFAANPREALRIRARDFSEDSWSEGLLKVWTFRNTIHVIRADELGLFLSAKGDNGPWGESWWGVPAAVKPYWSEFIREKVAAGVEEREALKAECRRAGMDEELLGRVFHGWGGLIKEMSDRGLIAYRPGAGKRFFLPEPPEWMDRDEARRILLERYFRRFSPASAEDCATFTGFGLPEVRGLMKTLPLRSVEAEGKEYFFLGVLPRPRPLPACVYLAGFDQLLMGYKDRTRLLDPEDKLLAVNQAGIAYPGILLYGRLRARWKKEPGRLLITPYHPLSPAACRLAAAAGRRLFGQKELPVVFLPPCRP